MKHMITETTIQIADSAESVAIVSSEV